MPNDTTLQSVFDYAEQGKVPGGGNLKYAVYATYVAHFPNSHPPQGDETADLVTYASGPLTLSDDKQSLSGEFTVWRNIHTPAVGGDVAPAPEDYFPWETKQATIAISVSSAGQATTQQKLKGKPIGGVGPMALNATYQSGMFTETSAGGVRSLSFTFGAK